MNDMYAVFREALYDIQRETGLGAIRLSRFFGVSRDMMKSLLTGRRRSGFRTIMSVVEGCEAGLQQVPHGPLHQSLQRLRDVVLRLGDAMAGTVSNNVPNTAAAGPVREDQEPTGYGGRHR
jgi:hypothetical protein